MDIVLVDKDVDFCNNLSNFFKNTGDINIIEFFNSGSDAINFIEKKKKSYDLIMLDLSTPEVNVPKIIEILPNSCNIIALSDKNKSIKEYINFPYFQRVFQKPISCSAITNYICIQNGIETFDSIRKKVLTVLTSAGFNINHDGTSFLADGVVFSLKNKISKLAEIYTFVAFKHNTSPQIITWSINNAINKTIKMADFTKLSDVLKITQSQRLTAKYIISFFKNYSF